MPGNKKKQDNGGASEERLEGLVHEAMLHLGWVLPMTPEDVARVEEELDESAELPHELRDPYTIFDAPRPPQVACPSPPANDDVVECLARVAREGKGISPEVEERMRQDRERAEQKADDRT
jgi:hypothetical protein